MDDRRFDAFTRALAVHPTRRKLMRGMIGGIVGGVWLRGALAQDDGTPTFEPTTVSTETPTPEPSLTETTVPTETLTPEPMVGSSPTVTTNQTPPSSPPPEAATPTRPGAANTELVDCGGTCTGDNDCCSGTICVNGTCDGSVGKLVVKSVDENGQPLPRFCLSLYTNSGPGPYDYGDLVVRRMCDQDQLSDGTIIVGLFGPGEYYVVDAATPEGHAPARSQLVIVIAGEVATVILQHAIGGRVVHCLLDERGEKLTHAAELVIRPIAGAAGPGAASSSSDWFCQDWGLSFDPGNYHVYEDLVPLGYAKPSDQIITVVDGQTTTVTIPHTLLDCSLSSNPCNGSCCDPAAACIGGGCIVLSCTRDVDCPTGVCCSGSCCATGACCNGTCTQLGTFQNCRTCGDVCLEDSQNFCMHAVCDPVKGCLHLPFNEGLACDPSNVTSTCIGGLCLPSGIEICLSGTRVCQSQGDLGCADIDGEVCSKGRCVNLLCDDANCGQAGHACRNGMHCVFGTCVAQGTCPPVSTSCGTHCCATISTCEAERCVYPEGLETVVTTLCDPPKRGRVRQCSIQPVPAPPTLLACTDIVVDVVLEPALIALTGKKLFKLLEKAKTVLSAADVIRAGKNAATLVQTLTGAVPGANCGAAIADLRTQGAYSNLVYCLASNSCFKQLKRDLSN